MKQWNVRRGGGGQGGDGRRRRGGGTDLVLIFFNVCLHRKHKVGIAEDIFAHVFARLRLVKSSDVPIFSRVVAHGACTRQCRSGCCFSCCRFILAFQSHGKIQTHRPGLVQDPLTPLVCVVDAVVCVHKPVDRLLVHKICEVLHCMLPLEPV
jgi:hypothetical protein